MNNENYLVSSAILLGLSRVINVSEKFYLLIFIRGQDKNYEEYAEIFGVPSIDGTKLVKRFSGWKFFSEKMSTGSVALVSHQ